MQRSTNVPRSEKQDHQYPPDFHGHDWLLLHNETTAYLGAHGGFEIRSYRYVEECPEMMNVPLTGASPLVRKKVLFLEPKKRRTIG